MSSKHNHINPEGSLREWAIDGKLDVWFRGQTAPELLPTSHVAVRSRFYLERQDDGTWDDSFEKTLGKAESRLLPAVRSVTTTWPPIDAARSRITEYIALQILRTPAWRAFHSVAVRNSRINVRPKWPGLPDTAFDAVEAALLKDHERHRRLAEQTDLVTMVLQLMH